MVGITQVNKELQPEDVMPSYEYQFQGLEVNAETSDEQKTYLKMFIKENIEVINAKFQSIPPTQLDSYLSGMKEMLAFVFLWIDSLNTQEQEEGDITN